MATAEAEKQQEFTNMYWSDFGEADQQQKAIFASYGPEQKKKRQEWLSQMHGSQMPDGPYPFYLRDYGWCQAVLPKEGPVSAHYCKRGDGNLDVSFHETPENGPITIVSDPKKNLQMWSFFKNRTIQRKDSCLQKTLGPFLSPVSNIVQYCIIYIHTHTCLHVVIYSQTGERNNSSRSAKLDEVRYGD